jgi:polysaccharide biosynthesis protein PslJ
VSANALSERRSAFIPAAFTAAAAVGAGASVLGHARIGLVPVLVVSIWLVANRIGQGLLAWQTQVAALILVVMFIPIRRYTLPGGLPFQLEPYRLLVALIATLWIAALLIDRRVRLRRTMLDGPMAAVLLALFCSIVPNANRIGAQHLQSYVVKTLTFFVSYVIVYYIITSVVRTWHDIDVTLALLVGSGVVVGVSAIVEARTGFNAFNHLRRVLPILHQHTEGRLVPRGARLRALASAQHPIALGAVLVLLLPYVTYLSTRGHRNVWLAGGGILALAAIATESRTAIVMLVVEAIVFLRLRPGETRRLWPLLIPLFVAMHIAVPGAVGTLKDAFLPKGGIVAEQQGAANTRGSGRLADLSPTLAQWSYGPILGQGEGTRIVEDGPDQNAQILDDQWLGLLLDTGIVGVASVIWLIRRALLRTAAEARADRSSRGLLLTASTAAVTAFAVGMFTYDAFSFIQVTFVFFILLALTVSALLVALPDGAAVALAEDGAGGMR